MALDNYRDVSSGGSDIGAGFQFEFYCQQCGSKWRSAFKPYRLGQITGLLQRFAFLVGSFKTAGKTTGNLADFGSRGARDGALADAKEQAAARYTECPECRHNVCQDCFDARRDLCVGCIEQNAVVEEKQLRKAQDAAAERTAHACPNCSTPNPGGGRFCAECGFDMASTHKSCPSCSAMLARQARFCTDCGHGF